jgi:hypothetical protein
MSVSPAWFLGLIKKVDLEVPEGLKSALAYLGEANSAAAKVERTDSVAASERVSMLRLIAVMTCGQYSFDPEEARSQTVPNLSHDLESVGLPLDKKTIRKWLREACELVPKQYWEKD